MAAAVAREAPGVARHQLGEKLDLFVFGFGLRLELQDRVEGGQGRMLREHRLGGGFRGRRILPGGEPRQGLLQDVHRVVFFERAAQKRKRLFALAPGVQRVGDAAQDERQVFGMALRNAAPVAKRLVALAQGGGAPP